MANMFTTREGKQVPIVAFTLPDSMMVEVLRLREDFAERGDHLSTYGVVDAVLDRGIKAIRNSWAYAQKANEQRNLGKVIQHMLSKGVPMSAIATFLEEKTGKKVNLGIVEVKAGSQEVETEEVEEVEEVEEPNE